MKIMKFEGASMRDAVAKVKAELGDQAVIVSTRQIKKGLLGGTACEISAAIEDDVDDSRRGPRTFGNAYASQSGNNNNNNSNDRNDRGNGPSQSNLPSEPTRTLAQQDADLERLLGPLRGEIKSLRALVRAAASDSRGTAELRAEVAALKKLVEDLRAPNQPPPNKPVRGSGPIAMAQLTAPSTARVLMLVGPTGVGKTTTIAKLAARAALIEGKRVALITADNYRVGGVDQIRTFADLIGCPLRVVDSPADIAAAIDPDDELTLIDTAGRSPRDTNAIRELASQLGHLVQITGFETHLVIPANTGATGIDEIVERYRPLAPHRLLFTKLDEIEEAPELARAPARLGLPITWVTTGQAVPEDLEEPTPARVLDLATAGLGQQRPRTRTQAA